MDVDDEDNDAAVIEDEPLPFRPALPVANLSLQQALQAVHEEIVAIDSADAKVFLYPVNDSFAPGYSLIVKRPIDSSIIGQKIIDNQYKSAWEYIEDMSLMFENALAYNRRGSFHNRYAYRLQTLFTKKAEELLLMRLRSHHYCCGTRRLLSGVSYRCRAATCFIQYGSFYWQYILVDGEEQEEFSFCQIHYSKLAKDIVLPRYLNGTGGDIKFQKAQLVRLRHNTPLVQENLVTCSNCGHVDHEICVMHNSYLGLPYLCYNCQTSPVRKYSPLELPRCYMSDILEAEVRKVPVYGTQVVVRVVNVTQETSDTKPLFRSRFPEQPQHFPYTRKVILAFIEIEGCAVCFFGMTVQEYDDACPPPNARRTYLSLLDSVKLPKALLPSASRTAIYHGIVRGYLRYCSARGFLYTHIYTCPPRKGQNYIFPFKPDDQKEISLMRLRQWYHQLLQDASKGDDASVTHVLTLDLALPNATFSQVPYFDGDNWPEIMDDIIKIDDALRKKEGLPEGPAQNGALVAAATCPSSESSQTPKKKSPERPIKTPRLSDSGNERNLDAYALPVTRHRSSSSSLAPASPLHTPQHSPEKKERSPKLTKSPSRDGKTTLLASPTVKQEKLNERQANSDATKPKSVTRFRKPSARAGYYEGHPPVPLPPPMPDTPHFSSKRKRHNSSSSKQKSAKPSKPKVVLTAEMRLNNVITATKRDFLVVKVKSPEVFVTDPDKDVAVASTGEDFCVAGVLRAERLEFSSLRHIKFSTMVLLHALISPIKALKSRYPDNKLPY